MSKKFYISMIFSVVLLSLGGGCRVQQNAQKTTENNQIDQSNSQNTQTFEPTIQVSPAHPADGGYLIADSPQVKINIAAGAPAQEAQIFFSPVTAADEDENEQTLKLKTIIPDGQDNANFIADLQFPPDFNGELWAQVRYATGEVKETERRTIALAEPTSGESQNATAANDSSNSESALPDTDESARSDKLTNGKIVRATFKEGDGNIKITVNVPAFLLTFWQDGKEIKTYYVGVGRKKFPIPVGMRDADKIILNPDWIPPDSSWVRKSGLEPYERIPADSPRNPLGKIKIPLGDAYLLHEADSPNDLGNLVSHGCVRVLRDDLFDITKMIAAARRLPISAQEIQAARRNSDRRVVDLNGKIPVDINYDSMVVENGILSIYPDVYERQTNTVENLRRELEDYGISAANLDDSRLEKMLKQVDSRHKFVVALTDIKNNRIEDAGKAEPLTPQQAETKDKQSKQTEN